MSAPGKATVIRRDDLVPTVSGRKANITTACVELYQLPHKPPAYTHSTVGFGYSDLYYADDEGISWIRGHHLQGSKAVNALHVAYALRHG